MQESSLGDGRHFQSSKLDLIGVVGSIEQLNWHGLAMWAAAMRHAMVTKQLATGR